MLSSTLLAHVDVLSENHSGMETKEYHEALSERKELSENHSGMETRKHKAYGQVH